MQIAALRHPLATVASRVLPSGAKMGLKRLQRAYVRTFWAFTAADLCNALQRLGVEPGDFLMVHSSFDKFLGFRGGPVEAIHALQDVVGPRGTLMMPTLPFTGSAIEYTSRDLVFDVRRTASRMGFITEVFRRGPEVVRSLHPTHSVAVWGNKADAIIAGHHVAETPCGRRTPYGKLLECDGKILFAGVPVSTMTFFHFVEEELEPRMPFPLFAPEEYALRWKDEAGVIGVSKMRLFSLRLAGHRDLNPLASELQRRKQWREWRVGRLRLILLRAREVYDATFALAERGVFCYERLVLAGHEPAVMRP
ncbi:MAG: AAC(3) family N-acetyltransferase [Chloroflexi bacterium]|nr:MAG: AAC(3) family N-acetyltransferase [Chloroflexota bacterium]